MHQNPQPPHHLETLEPLLKDSIEQFLTQYRNGRTHFSDFDSIFSRILQDFRVPPLEFVWFYSAVRFYSSRLAFRDDCVKLAVSFFQLLVSCSDSYNGAKRVAILSPVAYQLSCLVSTRKEAKRDIENLLDGIISYISMCSVEESEEDGALMASGSCFVDLTRVWVVDEVSENCTIEDCLEIFMPFVSDELRRGICFEPCRVGYLAGIVASQVFLLSLCLKFDLELKRSELEKNLRDCMVQMISGFRSYDFLDIILKMLLLEPDLPVTLLLGPEDEVVLWEILTEVMITSIENLFLNPENGASRQSSCLKNLAIHWLFLVHNAIESVRRKKDQEKTSDYMSTFSNSCLPSHLINWVISQGELVKDGNALRNSTPVVFIQWLLSLEDQGLRVFDCDRSRNYAKNIIHRSRTELNLHTLKPTRENPDEKDHLLTSTDRAEQDKFDRDTDMADSVVPSLSVLTSGTKKRREERHMEGQTPVKLLKHRHNLHTNSKFLPLPFSDSLVGGPEVDVADMEL